MRRNTPWLPVAAVVVGALISGPALAYVGPGAGLTALGSVVALFAAIGLALVGFVWYPVKRLRRRLRAAPKEEAGGPTG